MKKLKELPLYRDTYELLGTITDLLRSFPKLYRYNLGDKLMNSALELFSDLSLLCKYNSDLKYYDNVDSYLKHYQYMKAIIRVCNEKRILTSKEIAKLAVHLRNIERNLENQI